MILTWRINNDLKNHICPFFLFSLCERGASLKSFKWKLAHSAVIITSYNCLSLYSLQKSHVHCLISFIWYSCEAVMDVYHHLQFRHSEAQVQRSYVPHLVSPSCRNGTQVPGNLLWGVPSHCSRFPHKNVLPYCFYSYIILKISLKKCTSL